jgi:hypothetical protein
MCDLSCWYLSHVWDSRCKQDTMTRRAQGKMGCSHLFFTHPTVFGMHCVMRLISIYLDSIASHTKPALYTYSISTSK